MAAVQAGGLKTQSNFSGDTVFAGNQSFSDESISFLGSSKYIYALEDLTKRGLVKSLGSTIDGTTYEVRERGYEIADMIRDRNL